MKKLFALVDCNNFYASCERVFKPKLEGKPIVVLSNNDGCIIARSAEAKALGIPMGQPEFMTRELVKQHHVKVFSSNYALYGDMSARVMQILATFSPGIEVYSIDEAFLDLSNLLSQDLQQHAMKLCQTVVKWTGIPVSVGIAPSKTLAKLANRMTKKSGEKQAVAILQDTKEIEDILARTKVGDVWGIGKRNAHKLAGFGIHTALDLAQASDAFVKKHLTVVGLRTAKELRGEPCIELEQTPDSKQNICTSRSFGNPTTNLEHIQEATAYYATLCAAKLRRQQSCAKVLTVYLQAYPFKNKPAYYNSKTIMLPVATNSTLELIKYANMALKPLYKKGYRYKKSGVIVSEICPQANAQLPLLDTIDRSKHQRLMQAVDSINSTWGRDTVTTAAQGVYDQEKRPNPWEMKSMYRSERYTTHLNELLCVQA
ncbi:Y-family DNA polymerase [Pontibacter silvestris]|uniref:Y-family DNA polymerase n=1 Tax=Pontibacter silvestris TaxID=2305183 RepID=A0ABW4X2G9_9BACT|nr:Y-family DNA polymerase [Pontibacter silvestris]MCC9135947.1 Y-family DNA polymerase [Pontibacter silvestris]